MGPDRRWAGEELREPGRRPGVHPEPGFRRHGCSPHRGSRSERPGVEPVFSFNAHRKLLITCSR